MDNYSAENELILSMLSAASSLQKLNENLDRISLHSNSSPRMKPSSNERDLLSSDHKWQMESSEGFLLDRTSLSGLEDSASESQGQSLLRLSHTSSKFDSAFGSQTDEESLSIHSSGHDPGVGGREHRLVYSQSPRLSNQASQLRRPQSVRTASGESQKRRKKRRHHQLHDRRTRQDISSPDTTPDIQRAYGFERKNLTTTSNHSPVYQTTSAPFIPPASLEQLKRGDSTRSLSSTLSNSSGQSVSSKILSLELSSDDLRGMASKPHPKLVKQSRLPAVKLQARQHQLPVESHEPVSDMESCNSGASTPVVAKKFQPQMGELLPSHKPDKMGSMVHRPPDYPLEPQIIVIDPQQHKMKEEKRLVQNDSRRLVKEGKVGKKEHRATPKTKKVTIVVDSNKTTASPPPARGTVFYHESLTPQPSPRQHGVAQQQLPWRYEVSPTLGVNEADSVRQHGHRINAPKRSMSILQRLRRRRGSFKTEKKRQERRVTVKRSFSDRMTYDIRKGWIDYEEDLEFISNPSRLRRVGRMIARKAGTLHIVQLNRPPSGMYGIYISQSDARQGIFISRFADSNAAKFYSGLLSPGDEIIRVNKEDVKEKTVDYVYDLLEKLDSVIFSIVPVCSRPDW